MQITVQIRNVYGCQTIYPLCERSKLFAKIAGTTTLTRHAIADIKALGYIVQIKQPELTI